MYPTTHTYISVVHARTSHRSRLQYLDMVTTPDRSLRISMAMVDRRAQKTRSRTLFQGQWAIFVVVVEFFPSF